MERKDTLWKTSIVFPEPNGEFFYNYNLKIKKSSGFFFSSVDEVVDEKTRTVFWGIIQRDILSITSKPFEENDKNRGIAAHIKDILQEPPYKIQTAFLEIDNLMSRNSLKYSNWNDTFTKILEGQITKNECLLFLHCTQRNYVTWIVFKDRNIATKIWTNVQHLDQESKDVCMKYVEEIFQIYKASSTTECSPLHFINDTESLLDVPSLHKVLHSRSFPVHKCSESLKCLQRALKFILNQNEESGKLQDLVCLLFECIPEREILEGFFILKEFNAPDEKKKLKENTLKHVIAIFETIITKKVKFANLCDIYEIISKAEYDLRIALVSHCEMEIVSQITNQEIFQHMVWKDLEQLCEEKMLFQTIDHQILLLDALLKHPASKIPRNFIKFVLTHLQNIRCERAKETLEKAYEVLLNTVYGIPSEAKLMSYFEEYDYLCNLFFFQTNRDLFKKRLQSHVSEYPITSVLKIHADVENLQIATIDFYCQLLKDQLKNQTFFTKFEFFEKHWSSVDTR